MGPSKTRMTWGWALALAWFAALAPAEEPQAELAAAQKAYESYYKEWDSLAMARAATREVAVSARRTAENDLDQMLAARQADVDQLTKMAA